MIYRVCCFLQEDVVSEQEGVEAKLRTLLPGELGPAGRRLLGRAFAVMYERGNILGLHGMIGRCCDALRSKDEGQSPTSIKRCAARTARSLACKCGHVCGVHCPPFSYGSLSVVRPAEMCS